MKVCVFRRRNVGRPLKYREKFDQLGTTAKLLIVYLDIVITRPHTGTLLIQLETGRDEKLAWGRFVG